MDPVDEVIRFALDHETIASEQEQLDWIAREPSNPAPFYNLAQLRRMQWKQEEGLALLLHAVSLDANYAPAHVALAEIYAVKEDYRAAWKHADAARDAGSTNASELLARHNIPRL